MPVPPLPLPAASPPCAGRPASLPDTTNTTTTYAAYKPRYNVAIQSWQGRGEGVDKGWTRDSQANCQAFVVHAKRETGQHMIPWKVKVLRGTEHDEV